MKGEAEVKQCIKIRVQGKVQDSSYRTFTQKHAQKLGIEGTIQNGENGSVVIYASGSSDHLDKLIDYLYKGTAQSQIDDLTVEPLVSEKNFRGVFRIIGE